MGAPSSVARASMGSEEAELVRIGDITGRIGVVYHIRPRICEILKNKNKNFIKRLSERGFDPRTCGLWAHHASAAPL